ncbi:MAG: DNA repair protein [Clostridia bacterium]|nr:DNA repair protein [Clostridia bacterium]
MEERMYACIDLKSFYASCECVERGLDSMKTNLVVADPARGKGAICLAVSPSLKAHGVRNRCRLYEIPDGLEYIVALPRMKLYMEYSAKIYSIYLKYISKEDIHVYSIDECFIDLTDYMKIYGMSEMELAKMLMDKVLEETGIYATAGVGTNMFLAKVALDITAKYARNRMRFLDKAAFEREIWHHRPITDIWNVGRGIALRLEKHGVYDLFGVCAMSEKTLYKEFGVNAEFLIDHAHGEESCTIRDIQSYQTKSSSISNGQILFEDYNYDDAKIVLREMVDMLSLDLVDKGLLTNSISLNVGYSKDVINAAGGTKRLGEYTNSSKKLVKYFLDYFDSKVKRGYPIRKINIGFNNLTDDYGLTIDIMGDSDEEVKERNLQKTVIAIKKKYGKNAILKGTSLEERATGQMRNKLIGGHNGGE